MAKTLSLGSVDGLYAGKPVLLQIIATLSKHVVEPNVGDRICWSRWPFIQLKYFGRTKPNASPHNDRYPNPSKPRTNIRSLNRHKFSVDETLAAIACDKMAHDTVPAELFRSRWRNLHCAQWNHSKSNHRHVRTMIAFTKFAAQPTNFSLETTSVLL